MNEENWWQKMFDQKYLDTYLGTLTAERTKEEVDFIIQAANLDTSESILDLACGHGRHCNELAQRGFKKITGLDYSQVFLDKANADAEALDTTVRFQHGDMKDLPFNNEFDVILLLFTAFGYFDDTTNKNVLKQIHKSLKPNGRFLIDSISAEAVINRFESEGIKDPQTGTIIITRQLDMNGRLIDETEWFNKDEQTIHCHREWEGDTGKEEYDYYIHVYTMPQYEQMLTEAGFIIENSWGDTLGNPFKDDDSATRAIILAKKPS